MRQLCFCSLYKEGNNKRPSSNSSPYKKSKNKTNCLESTLFTHAEAKKEEEEEEEEEEAAAAEEEEEKEERKTKENPNLSEKEVLLGHRGQKQVIAKEISNRLH